MTFELSNLWPMKPFRDELRKLFPSATQERLDATTLNITVDSDDADVFTDWCDEHQPIPLLWRLI